MKKRMLAILMTIAMVGGVLPITSFAGEDSNFKDTKGHWASAQIDKWSGLGIVRGSDGYFRPDAPITRGEMAVILDKVMGYQKTGNNTFSDLDQNFYTDAVLKINAAGVMVGDGDTLRPKDYISRQEAAVMLGRALDIAESNGASSSFADNDVVGSWARGYVKAMSEKGLISGVGQNRFAPTENITRGAVVTILDHAIKGLCTEAKEYVGNVDGTVIVNANGAVLKNMVISGDLIVAEGVGKGDVTLDNVTVSGKSIVRGGGESSIYVKGSSQLGEVNVIKISDGAVSIKVAEDANIDTIIAQDGSLIVSGKVKHLSVTGSVAVTTIGATIKEVDVTGDATVVLDKDSKVETLTVGARSSVTVAGTVTKLVVASSADATTIAVAEGATVSTLVTAGTIKVDNKGIITNAEINADDVVIGGKVPTTTVVDKKVKTLPVDKDGKTIAMTAPAEKSKGGGGGGGGSHSSNDVAVSAITITGNAVVGATLTAAPIPDTTTGTYQWMRCDTADGTYAPISGATTNKYTTILEDAGKFIKVTVVGTGNYTGKVTSVATAKVLTVAQTEQVAADAVAKLVVGKELKIPEGELGIASKKLGYVTEYVNSLMKDGVTATVLPNIEAGKYEVTLKLNDATATKTITMTFVASTVVVDEDQVAADAVAKLVVGKELKIPEGDLGIASKKLAYVTEYVNSLMKDGVTATVLPNIEAGKYEVTLKLNEATATKTIAMTFVASTVVVDEELIDSNKEKVIIEKLEGFAEKSLEEKEAVLKDIMVIVKGMNREPKEVIQEKIKEATDLYNQEAGMTELADLTKEEVIAKNLKGFADKSLEEKETILKDIMVIVKGMAREPKEAVQEKIKEATDLYDKEVADVKLDSAIASVGNLVQAKYTAETWNNLTDALDAAVAVQAGEDATVGEMIKVTNNLNDVIKGLVEKEAPTVDKTELETLVSSIADILQNKEKYTVDSYDALLEAYDAANAVIDNKEATNEEVNTAKLNLEIAIKDIVTVEEAGQVAAEAVVSKINALPKVEALRLSDESAVSEAIEAYNGLTDAQRKLVPLEVKHQLTDATNKMVELLEAAAEQEKVEAVAAANKVIAEVGRHPAAKYTKETWASVEKAYDAANAVLANEDATGKEILAATIAIQTAIEGLVEKEAPTVDKTELETLVSSIGDILQNQAKYTEETYNTVLDAYDAANAVIGNKEATQAEVGTAKSNLQIAVDNMVTKGNATATARTIDGDNAGVNPLGAVIATVTYNDDIKTSDLSELEVSIYNGDKLLSTNILSFGRIDTKTKDFTVIDCPFNLGSKGLDKWSWNRGAYAISGDTVAVTDLPDKAVVKYVKDGITYVSESIVTLAEKDIPKPYVAPVVEPTKGNATATARTVAGDNKEVNPLGAVSINLKYGDEIKSEDIEKLTIELYNNEKLLATNELQPEKLNGTLKVMDNITSPFNLGRTKTDKQWAWVRGTYKLEGDKPEVVDLPNRVVATYVVNGITYVSESIVTLTEKDIPKPYVATIINEPAKEELVNEASVNEVSETPRVDGGVTSDDVLEDVVKEEAEAGVEKQRATITKDKTDEAQAGLSVEEHDTEIAEPVAI